MTEKQVKCATLWEHAILVFPRVFMQSPTSNAKNSFLSRNLFNVSETEDSLISMVRFSDAQEGNFETFLEPPNRISMFCFLRCVKARKSTCCPKFWITKLLMVTLLSCSFKFWYNPKEEKNLMTRQCWFEGLLKSKFRISVPFHCLSLYNWMTTLSMSSKFSESWFKLVERALPQNDWKFFLFVKLLRIPCSGE